MIFAHGIIPHTHFEHDTIGRHGQIHSSVHHHNQSDLSRKFNSQCEDIGACHISNFLFHQFNQDNLISQTGKENSLCSVLQTEHIIFEKDHNFQTNNFFGSDTLRAPPLT